MKLSKIVLSLVLSIALLLSTIMFAMPVSAEKTGTTYYVDSQSGDDGNSGTSQVTPWKTLGKVSGSTFLPGDSVLLKSGSVWNGTFQITFSGDETEQITIGKYGEGPRPIINGCGAGDAVKIINQQYITLRDIEITNFNPENPGDYKTERHTRSGVSIRAYHQGAMNKIQLINLDIHDVTGQSLGNGFWLPDADGTPSNKNSNSAIAVSAWQWEENTPADKYSTFTDMLIEDCYIHDVTTVGINIDGQQPVPEINNQNLIIRNNTITRTGNDFIVVGKSNNPIIENNVGYDAGVFNEDYTYIAGMWVWGTYGATLQYNEVARVNYYDSSVSDSAAFDTDIVTHGDHYYQYNYSHDNTGGFFMSMGQLQDGVNYIRYNISQNDGDNGCTGKTLSVNDPCYFYNNVFYNDTDEGISIRDGNDDIFINNIFYTPRGNNPFPAGIKFYNNNFFGAIPPSQGINNITDDPMFVNPGKGQDGINTVDGYKLQPDSPMIGAGKVVEDNGGKDFWGNSVYTGSPDIGVYEDPDSDISDSVAPDKPLNFMAKDKTDTSVILSWSAVENGIPLDSEIYDATTDTKIASIIAKNTITINGLTPDTEYKYYVISKDLSGNSSPRSDVLTVTTTIEATIVDNSNAEITGSWAETTGDSSGFYGEGYLRIAPGNGSNSVKWTPDLPETGYYLVSYWLPRGKFSRASDAEFKVAFDGGIKNYTVNERLSTGGWEQLGVHKFEQGTSGYVELTDNGNGEVVADAIKFQYLDGYSVNNIKDVKLTAVTTQLRVGETTKLSFVGIDDNGKTMDLISEGLQVEYTSENAEAVTVSEDGTVEAIDNGVSDIIATVAIGDKTFSSDRLKIYAGPYFKVSEIEFTDADGKVIDRFISKGAVKATTTIINSKEQKQSVSLIVAVFNQKGFVNSSVSEVIINKYENVTLSTTVHMPFSVEGCYVKVYVWDGLSSMKPLVPVTTFQQTGN